MTAEMYRAADVGADMIELRLDFLEEWEEAEVTKLLDAARRFEGEVIATFRITDEGGHFDEDESTRISRMEFVGLHDAVDYLDVEYDAWKQSANIQQKIGLVCAVNKDSSRPRKKLVLSKHNFDKTPAWYELRFILDGLAREPGHVDKIACKTNSIVDSLHLLDVLHSGVAVKPMVILGMGETGVLTRILGKKLGALLTFASLEAGKESAPGQVTATDMRGLYRWDAIRPETQVYGVIGCPVAHSMSPAILNGAFTATGYDGVYLPLRVEPSYDDFAAFVNGMLHRQWLDLRGCSVTIPHKQNLLKWVDMRAGYIEPLTQRIGAANTLVIAPGDHEDGSDAEVSAYNTDYRGAMEALCSGMNCDPAGLKGMKAAVLGAGGVSRAIVAGLRDCGCEVDIYNRTQEKAKALADEFGANAKPLDERERNSADVIVNCTSIGMHPDVDGTPMPAAGLKHRPVVFDTVYNPIDTRLLREAREADCTTVDGVAMFVNQGAAQFELWTGREAPKFVMRKIVLERLTTSPR
jgi:3-dehydroquinate dehydratase/shikimate dehydrogenase